ncbi:Uu.00g093030.m01.CDS01 [Anthostomella pinea]|uniref:Uu.00g093030.m01.CDS01 n=1 Tax=Anthostomella pinea TaxID=933095 RepID=A0AAI8YKJ4_9PEZI|nr:Uu.00g093030.m01.CDS01 [Anthostomella pinea]
MCIIYPHLSIYGQPHCETVLGQKHRNRYCREALDARRLGHCSTGVQVAEEIRNRETAKCAECKSSSHLQDRPEKHNHGLSSTEAPVSTTRNKRKAKKVLEHAFEKPLEMKRSRNIVKQDEVEDPSEDISFAVQSPPKKSRAGKPQELGVMLGLGLRQPRQFSRPSIDSLMEGQTATQSILHPYWL